MMMTSDLHSFPSGTSGSTMSLLALRRVAGWNDGAVSLVSYLDR